MSFERIEYAPNYSVSAGDYLSTVLSSLDMTQSELAARTGLSTKHINQIVKHGAAISASTAADLEFATNVPAELWASLDARNQARAARATTEARLGESLSWLEPFNLKELKRRGLISSALPSVSVATALLRFFGVSEPSGWNRVWQPSLTSFRRSPSFAPDTTATTLWLRAGQRKAARIETTPFDERLLRGAVESIRKLTIEEPGIAVTRLQDLMANLGVAVVLVQEFEGCRASGATWWATPTKAVVLLSNRGKREDRFWFSFFHEIGHVLLHAKRETFLDQNRAGDEVGELPPWETPAPSSGFIDDGSRDSDLERQADDFASEALIPIQHRVKISGLRSVDEVRALALEIGVAPGIVAGRYQFETGDFKKFNDLRRTVPNVGFEDPL